MVGAQIGVCRWIWISANPCLPPGGRWLPKADGRSMREKAHKKILFYHFSKKNKPNSFVTHSPPPASREPPPGGGLILVFALLPDKPQFTIACCTSCKSIFGYSITEKGDVVKEFFHCLDFCVRARIIRLNTRISFGAYSDGRSRLKIQKSAFTRTRIFVCSSQRL